MSKPLIALTAVIGLLITAFASLLLLLDNPETYKQQLSQSFEEETGYGLEINGDLTWQYFPPIAIGMSQVAVTIPGVDLPLASLDSANVDLKLLPLLFGGGVEVSGLNIDGITINASVDNAGNGNWEVLEDATQSDETNDPASADTDQSPSENNLTIDIGGISVTNTLINYEDLSSNSKYVINLANLSTGPLGTGVKTDIQASLRVKDEISSLTIENEMSGKFAINESLDEFLLEAISISVKLEQPGSPVIETNLLLNGKVDTANEQANINNSSLSIAGAKFNLDVDVSDLFSDLTYNGKISAESFNAKPLLAMLDAGMGSMTNPDAMSKVALSMELKGSSVLMALTKIKLDLDSSAITGGIEFGLDERTSIDFGLNIDEIKVSDYLENTSEPTSTSNSTTADTNQAEQDSELIPTELLSGMDINGQFSIDSLTYDSWLLQDFNMMVANQGAKLLVNGNANAYQGAIGFSLDSRYPNNIVNSKAELNVSSVDVAQALEIQAITGTVELKTKHNWSGAMMSDLINSLEGRSNFEIVNGTLDVRPIKQLAAIVDSVQGSQSGISEWPDLLPFDSLNGEHQVNQGIADNQTFSANLENMRIAGTGGIEYFANQMLYDIEIELLENVGGQFTVNEKLAGVKWPLRCEGSLDADPVSLCLPDRNAVTALLKKLAEQEVKRRGRDAINKKIEEAVPDELKDAAKGLLKGLFGN